MVANIAALKSLLEAGLLIKKPFSAQDKADIKEHWRKLVKAHYHGLLPSQHTKLIHLGTGQRVTAVPLTAEVTIMSAALRSWTEQERQEADAQRQRADEDLQRRISLLQLANAPPAAEQPDDAADDESE